MVRLPGPRIFCRRQSGRVMLLGLTGTSLLLFIVSQSNLSATYHSHQAPHPPPYPLRRIQDYQSHEYTSSVYVSAPDEGSIKESDLQKHTEKVTLNIKYEIINASHGPSDVEEKSIIIKPLPTIPSDQGENVNQKQNIHIGLINKDHGKSTEKQTNNKNLTNIISKAEVVKKADDVVVNPSLIIEKFDTKNVAAGLLTEEQRRILVNLLSVSVEDKVMAVLNYERKVVENAMKDYIFHPHLNKGLDDMILEKGGRPIRNLVITTWRSGSTFLGDVLQSHPATYYHYEPLLDFGINQVRSGDNATQAINNLRHLLTCNYSDMEHYLSYGPDHPWLFLHNTRLWLYCNIFPDICYQPKFLSPFCSLFPFQSLKTVRLRLNLTKELLQDKDLGVNVLLLVRDPRGTMQSRHHREWCPGNPDCNDPAKLCQDLVNDFNTAIAFRRQFPHSFKVVRYEDISFDAYNMTKELFNFFRLNYHPKVQEFLDSHTKRTIGGVSSTYRDSKTAPIHWQNDLPWKEVDSIQKVCRKALKLWGYEIAKDEKHLRTFMPVGKFRHV